MKTNKRIKLTYKHEHQTIDRAIKLKEAAMHEVHNYIGLPKYTAAAYVCGRHVAL